MYLENCYCMSEMRYSCIYFQIHFVCLNLFIFSLFLSDLNSGSVVGAVLLISLAALGVLSILAIAAGLAVAKNKTGHPTHEGKIKNKFDFT